MLSPSDTHQPDRPQEQRPRSTFSPSHTPHSDSGLSISSSSSSEIMGTPFDLGAQRFEYPFPKAQGSPTEFLPLSSSITAQSPPWPVHVSKSFPLTPPPLGRLKAHPKLRPASVREPPVPPGLVKRRSRIPGVQHQSSSEEPSDVGDDIARGRRSSRFHAEALRSPLQPDDATLGPSKIVPMKQAATFPMRSFDRPSVEDPAGLAMGAGSAEAPRPPVLRRERKVTRVHQKIHSFAVQCWLFASQLYRWVLYSLGRFFRA